MTSIEAGCLEVGREVVASGTVEIITEPERRRCLSVADKLRIPAECDAPGVQISEVAARHGIYRSLAFQRRRQTWDVLLVAELTPEFVLVHVAVVDRREEMLSELAPTAPPSPSSRKVAAMEIEFPTASGCGSARSIGLVALHRLLAALRS